MIFCPENFKEALFCQTVDRVMVHILCTFIIWCCFTFVHSFILNCFRVMELRKKAAQKMNEFIRQSFCQNKFNLHQKTHKPSLCLKHVNIV